MAEITSIFTGFESVQKGTNIHPSALVAKSAELGSDVQVGPNAIVGPLVKLGDRVRIGSGAIIEGVTSIGADSTVFPFATVGSTPQDLKFKGEDAQVIIGKRNRIREYVNISIGTEGGGGRTVLGDDNLVMVYTHVGHDCVIGDQNIFANGVQLAGHVIVGSGAVFGGLAAAHQFSKIGDLAMIAAGSMVSQDVPPYCMVHGDRARINGLNVVGLRRAKIKNLSDIKQMYRLTYNEDLSLADACVKITAEIEPSVEREKFLSFLQSSERGIVR